MGKNTRPTETLQKHLTKKEKDIRLKREKIADQQKKLSAEPPEYLSSLQQKEWRRVVPLINSTRGMGEKQLTVLLRYLSYWQEWQTYQKMIGEEGYVVVEHNTAGDEVKKIAPWVKEQKQVEKVIRPLTSDLGLTFDASIKAAAQHLSERKNAKKDSILNLIKGDIDE